MGTNMSVSKRSDSNPPSLPRSHLCTTCRKMIDFILKSNLRLSSIRHVSTSYTYHEKPESLAQGIAHGCALCVYLERKTVRMYAFRYPLTATIFPGDSEGEEPDMLVASYGFTLCGEPYDQAQVFLLDYTKLSMDEWQQHYYRIIVWKTEASIAQRQMSIANYDEVHSSASEPCLALANRWIQTCISSHPVCQRYQGSPLTAWMPTRLIFCGSKPYRLQETASLKSVARYMTLSHCWGIMENRICLKSDLLAAWKEELPDLEGIKTFSDAIEIARACGVSYIWIDSLCIIQDSERDWAAEAGLMGKVYQNSYCNISATSAKDDTEGCFHVREAVPSVTFSTSATSYQSHKLSGQGLIQIYRRKYAYEHNHAPVMKRGWIVQERYTSPRIIHFCKDQLFFECNHHSASEVFPAGEPHVEVIYGLTKRSLCAQPPGKVRPYKGRMSEAFLRWMRILKYYSQTRLTMREDALIAMSAIARDIQGQLHTLYIAGIFETYVLIQLCWVSIRDQDPSVERSPFESRCKYGPSWSWASVPRWRLRFNPEFATWRPLAEYTEAHIDIMDNDEFGRVGSGRIVLNGVLFPVGSLGDDISESDRVHLHPDCQILSTQELIFLPLITRDWIWNNFWYGLALIIVCPGLYRRVGFLEMKVHDPRHPVVEVHEHKSNWERIVIE